MKPHKHCELIKAWADGAEIEERRILDNNEWSKWYSFDCPWWVDSNDYGIQNHQQLKDKILLVMAKKAMQ